MNKTLSIAGIGLLGLVLGACELPQENAELVEVESANASAVVYTSSLRGAYILGPGSTAKYCAEPPPDIALDTLQKLAAEIKAEIPQAGEGSAELSSEVSGKVIELAGRTQLILLAREMLYRACELSLNNPNVSPDQILDMYGAVVQLVKDLGKADLSRAEADKMRALHKALPVVAARQAKIKIIVDAVADSDGNVDKAKLEVLIVKTNDAAVTGLKTGLLAQKTGSDLEQYLLSFGDNIVDPLFKAAKG